MADTVTEVPAKKPRTLMFLIALVVVFLLGFVPMWIKARNESTGRDKAEHLLTEVKMVKDLGSAAIDARRKEYEAARIEASAFFTTAHFELDRREASALSQQQRDGLQALLAPQDEVITLLARGDASAADRLQDLYVAVRKTLGI